MYSSCFYFIFFNYYYFSSGPPETDHLTPVKESAHCPRRDGVKTGQSAGTGRTGRVPLPWTKQGAGIERDPCPMSEIDAPALRNESPGRYEQDGMPPKSLIWIYHLIKRTWRDVCLLVWLCVSALYVHSCTLAGVNGEGTISVVAVKKSCKPTFIGLRCDARMSWNQISHFFYAILFMLCMDDVHLYILTPKGQDLGPVCCDTTWMFWGNPLYCVTIK